MLRLMCSPAVWCVVLLGCCLSCVSAQDDTCYTSGSVAGIVIATVVVTLVTAGLAGAFIWYLWKQRKAGYGDDKSQEKPIACPPMSPDKQLIVRENNDYAFDNPYFKDDETDHIKHDAAEKGESGFHLDNGDITPSQNAKASNGTTGHQKKNRPFSSLPFHAVFHPSGKKQRATTTMDDTYISKHLERISVPLRGHDFTGLGFNICGNMRDGIFVKDVLHRGPASESGKIKAGDRIVGVTVSFGAMVYEDALTILSYASPYDVKLELEKSPSANNVASVTNLPSSSPKRLGTSTSFRNCGQRRLFHPLYRSQSIDDLTQIGKDGFLNNSPAINTKTQKDPNASATPKRSQSVEASNGGPKSRSAFSVKPPEESKSLSSNSKGSRKSSTSSCDSTGKITTNVPLPEKTQPAPAKEECIKKEVKSSRFRVEQINVKSEAPIMPVRHAPPVKPARDSSTDEKNVQDGEDSVEKTPDPSPETAREEPEHQTITMQTEVPQGAVVATAEALEAEVGEKQPMAPPRKSTGTPAKRRAPAPPPVPTTGPTNSTKTETSADVHRADEQPSETVSAVPDAPLADGTLSHSPEPPPPPTSEVPDSKEQLEATGSSDVSSVASGEQPDPKEPEPSSPGKRKASSLGDLTTLERGSKKTSASSAILERAVSMDLQQPMPAENLTKQKRILREPAFEDDYDENREGDLIDTESGGLKRWDDGLDKVLAGLTNGHIKLNDEVLRDEEIMISSVKDEKGTPQQIEPFEGDSPRKKILTLDLDLNLDSSGSETTLPETDDPEEKTLTSTPSRKLIEVKDFIKDDDISLDDVPYLASGSPDNDEESSTAKHSIRTTSSSTTGQLFSPVTISIPIIKPDLTNYEKLPSPPPASAHPALDPSWRVSKITTNSSDESGRYPLERISVQSLYRPIFSSKDSGDTGDDIIPDVATEKLANRNESDSSEHYSTAQESSMDTSTMSVTLSPTYGNGPNVTVKTPNNAAGFAKTLIIPGPSEVENLLSLAAEPNTPPPQLEPPPKPIETE